jgi:hypothetical protein
MCIYTCMYTCMHIYMYICIHIYIYIHKYNKALKDLCKQRPIAASKVKVAAKIALKFSSDYKMAVHSIESFIRKV